MELISLQGLMAISVYAVIPLLMAVLLVIIEETSVPIALTLINSLNIIIPVIGGIVRLLLW